MKQKKFFTAAPGGATDKPKAEAEAKRDVKASRSLFSTWYELVSWNWRLMRNKFAAICGISAAVQIGMLLLAAADTRNAAMPYEAIFFGSSSWIAFLGGYIATVILGACPLLQKKNRTMYTVTTLPIPRTTLVLSYVGSAALALCGIIALQILLTIVCYFPTMAIAHATTDQVLSHFSAPLRYSLAMSLATHPLMRLLVPTSFGTACILILLVAAPAVLMPCAFLQTGKARVVAVCIGVAGALCCGALFALQLTGLHFVTFILFRAGTSMLKELLFVGGTLTLLMAISFLWAVRSMKRARHL